MEWVLEGLLCIIVEWLGAMFEGWSEKRRARRLNRSLRSGRGEPWCAGKGL